MKVCTCLNPLHTAMSIYGCMLGYTLISAEMADEDLRSFIQKIGVKFIKNLILLQSFLKLFQTFFYVFFIIRRFL